MKNSYWSDNHPVVSIGDLHGDYLSFLKCLKLTNMIDSNHNWTGSNTILVLIGDILDNARPSIGEEVNEADGEMKILFLCYDLKKQAQACKGDLVIVLGNHEIMNILGYFTYVSKDAFKEGNDLIKNKMNIKLNENNIIARRQLFNRNNEFYKKYILELFQAFVIVGKILFIHAGITPKLANKIDSLETIDIIVNNFLKNGSSSFEMITKNTLNFDILLDKSISPFWTRIYKPPISKLLCQKFSESKKKLGFEKMVIGHTPVFEENILENCNKSIFNIDTGISSAFGKQFGYLSALIIDKHGKNPKIVKISDK